jgi:hypothetical protein
MGALLILFIMYCCGASHLAMLWVAIVMIIIIGDN